MPNFSYEIHILIRRHFDLAKRDFFIMVIYCRILWFFIIIYFLTTLTIGRVSSYAIRSIKINWKQFMIYLFVCHILEISDENRKVLREILNLYSIVLTNTKLFLFNEHTNLSFCFFFGNKHNKNNLFVIFIRAPFIKCILLLKDK